VRQQVPIAFGARREREERATLIRTAVQAFRVLRELPRQAGLGDAMGRQDLAASPATGRREESREPPPQAAS
jgi:hypothetical protein